MDQAHNTSVDYCWLTMLADPVSQLAYNPLFKYQKTRRLLSKRCTAYQIPLDQPHNTSVGYC